MEKENVELLARKIGVAIQESPEYAAIFAARDANDADAELQDQIGRFNLNRMELNRQLSLEERDQEKISAMNDDLQRLYETIMKNEHMIAFNQAKEAFDTMVNRVQTIISKSISGEDPMTCDAEPASCGGNCSSCSGCH